MTLMTANICSCSGVPDPLFEPVRFLHGAAAVISLLGIPAYGIVSPSLRSPTPNSAMMKGLSIPAPRIYVVTALSTASFKEPLKKRNPCLSLHLIATFLLGPSFQLLDYVR